MLPRQPAVSPQDKPGTRLILLEGIPGSGKTTTAEWMHRWLGVRGFDAEWSSELRRDHPVVDRDLRRTHRAPGYGDRCAERWRAFAARVEGRASPAMHVLEGCLFQGTIRFLLEHDRPELEAERYFAATEAAIARLEPQIVYMVQSDPRRFMRERHVKRKGRDVIAKIAAHTETTPLARRQGWRGAEGMIEFYARYRALCDRLLERSRFPVLRLDTGTEDWNAVRGELGPWLESLVADGRRDARPVV